MPTTNDTTPTSNIKYAFTLTSKNPIGLNVETQRETNQYIRNEYATNRDILSEIKDLLTAMEIIKQIIKNSSIVINDCKWQVFCQFDLLSYTKMSQYQRLFCRYPHMTYYH